MKKTLILGATPNTTRTAYTAAHRLTGSGHEIVPIGIKKGEVAGKKIINDKSLQQDIDTITLYIGQKHQPEWYDYILKTKPQRIIFNPGTENPELIQLAENQGIKAEVACTLVMLSLGVY